VCSGEVLRQQQVGRIAELERELMALRGRHTETIQQLKKAFLQEKHDCQANADRRISEMSKQANQVTDVLYKYQLSLIDTHDKIVDTAWQWRRHGVDWGGHVHRTFARGRC